MMVVAMPELEECGAELFEIGKAMKPEKLLFECAKESLDASVAFGLPHERGRDFDAQEPHFGLEVAAHIHAAVVMTQPQAGGAAAGETTEVLFHSLTDRIERFESGSFFTAWMPTHSAVQ